MHPLRKYVASAAATILVGAAGVAAETAPASSPDYGVQIPADYRKWQMISAAHEAGRLNDIRVILGNDEAVEASRNGRRPFPDGTMFVRIAWKLEPSDRNNAFFGQNQSFVAGAPTNVQFELKDSKKYAATGGWGYAQLENGKAISTTSLSRTCSACHARLPPSNDSVFTEYAR